MNEKKLINDLLLNMEISVIYIYIGNLRVTLKYRITSKNSREQLRGEVQVQNIGNLIEGGIAKNLRNCHHITLIGL